MTIVSPVTARVHMARTLLDAALSEFTAAVIGNLLTGNTAELERVRQLVHDRTDACLDSLAACAREIMNGAPK
jgi:hypothetical protein